MTSPNSRRSRRVMPPVMVSLITELSCVAASRGLSSGQTIGAARTDVRSACCLPELRGANRLRRLYPLDDGELFKFNLKSSVCQRQTGLPKGNPPCVFPSFPPAPLRFACQSKTVPHRVAPVKLLYTVTSRGISTIKRMNKGTFRSPIKTKKRS